MQPFLRRLLCGLCVILGIISVIGITGKSVASTNAYTLYLPQIARPVPVVFASDHNSGWTLKALQADGSGETSLGSASNNNTAPLPAPDGQQIAFFSTRKGHNAAYIMDRNGSNQRKIADCIDICAGLSWAPDSRHVLLTVQYLTSRDVSASPSNELKTYLINIDAIDEARLVGAYAVWSPDGNQLAVLDGSSLAYSLSIVARDGSSSLELATAQRIDRNDAGSLVWSPDGSMLAFSVRDDVLYESYIVAVSATGGPLQQVAQGRDPAWAPDSRRLAFAGLDNALYQIELPADTPVRLYDQLLADTMVAWSPDGKQLAFATSNAQVAVLDPVSGAFQELASGTQPRWAPDSSRIAFVIGAEGSTAGLEQQPSVAVIPRDGGTTVKLGNGQAQHWLPDSNTLVVMNYNQQAPDICLQYQGNTDFTCIASGKDIKLAPDGMQLAYVSMDQLYVMNLHDRKQRRLSTDLQIESVPQWSPDSSRIGVAAGNAIHLFPVGDGEPVVIPVPDPGDDDELYFSWSPDGSRIGVVAGNAIHLFPVDDGELVVIPNPGGSSPLSFSWSPDGRMLAMANGALYTASSTDGTVQLIYIGVRVRDPLWSPDGSTIAFFAQGLYITDVRGEHVHLLQQCDEDDSLAYEHCSNARWSPDSQSLAYIYRRTQVRSGDQLDLNIVDIASREQRRLTSGIAPRWLPDGRHMAYMHNESFGFYIKGLYILQSMYTKLCISPVDDEAADCRRVPPGHGNVLSYDIAH